MTLRPWAKELKGLINAFKGLRVLTQLISICSGFCFFYYTASRFIKGFPGAEALSVVLALGLLICIECLVQYSLTKGVKMLMQRQGSWAVGLGILAVVTFAGSFFISTEGIYLAVSDTRDHFENLDSKYDDAVSLVKAEYDERIASIEASIQAIKAPSWNHGDLTTPQQQLLAQQRAKKDALYTERSQALEKLKKEHQADKQSVVDTAEKKASDYYMYVSIILVMELMTNVLISLWYYRIYEQEHPDEALEDRCKGAIAEQEDKIQSIMDAQFGSYANSYYNKMAGVMIGQQSVENARMGRLQIAARSSVTDSDYEEYLRYKAQMKSTRGDDTTIPAGLPQPEGTSGERPAPKKRAGFVVETEPDNNSNPETAPAQEREPEPVSVPEDSDNMLNDPKWHTMDVEKYPNPDSREVVELPYPSDTDTDNYPAGEADNGYTYQVTRITDNTDNVPPTFKGGEKSEPVFRINENGKKVPNGYCYCCHKPLVGKRKDAIWCGPVCKAEGNGFDNVKVDYLK